MAFMQYGGLALIILIASVTPLNIKALAVRSQVARIERVYKAHNLFKDGKIIPAASGDEFSAEEKKQIADSFSSFGISLSEPWSDKKLVALFPFISEDMTSENLFKQAFGFERPYTHTNDSSVCFDMSVDDDFVVDISGYSQMVRFDLGFDDRHDGKVLLRSAFGTVDVTDFINEVVEKRRTKSEEPLRYVASDGTVLFIMHLYVCKDSDGILRTAVCSGYALRK
ncbi:MAG: hypothetical protein IJ828_11740 [Treponema sp.]|nr:hypothetical protein [Treponema sp.]